MMLLIYALLKPASTTTVSLRNSPLTDPKTPAPPSKEKPSILPIAKPKAPLQMPSNKSRKYVANAPLQPANVYSKNIKNSLKNKAFLTSGTVYLRAR